MLTKYLTFLRRSVGLTALAATLSLALLVDALGQKPLGGKPPHHGKVSFNWGGAANVSVVALHFFFPARKEFHQLAVLSSFDTSLSSFRVPRSFAELEQAMFCLVKSTDVIFMFRFDNLPKFFTFFKSPDDNMEYVISSNCCCNFVSFPHMYTMSPSTILLKRFWCCISSHFLFTSRWSISR